MKFHLSLHSLAARATILGTVFGICCWLLYLVLSDFLVGALTDERIRVSDDASSVSFITAPLTDDRIGINPDLLAAVTRYLPNSPRLHMRLADFERYQPEDRWSDALFHAMRATILSPHDYRPRLILASIQESKGDLHAAEGSVRAALQLAQNSLEAHWLLGTLLLRTKGVPASLDEFRIASSSDHAYFRSALELVWDESGEDAAAVRAITPDNPNDWFALAQFLLQQGRPLESAAAFRQVGRDVLLGDPEAGRYLDLLIEAGHVSLAHELWCALMQAIGIIWNGGFESDILIDLAQFDWSIRPNDYVQVSIDSTTAHSGRHSLRLDFLGRETARLEDEIQQRILVRPGQRYGLNYYVKSESLAAPEGPRVVVSDVASEPALAGFSDWQLRTLEFTASDSTVMVAIKLQPRFSYEDPTKGVVWFDDFEIREVD